jgi:spiro-SPASM protein
MPDAITVSRWLAARRHVPADPLPAEIEIELTTDDPLPESTLRPRGGHAGRRGPMDVALFEKLIGELATRDDTRVVLGGFGDPLRHPEFEQCLDTCRQAGIFGLAVRTPAVDLDEKAIHALLEHRVDVLHVLIDAASAETYRRVHRADHFDRVIANLDRLFEQQRIRNQPQPLVVCELMKTRGTMDDLEAFYDHWIAKTGSAMITGPSHYAGQWPDHAVIPMSPPTRSPCQRIFKRVMVFADGRIPACDQDFTGRHALGSVVDTPLATIWQNSAFQSVRQSHLDRTYNAIPLCASCDEWHRP